MAFDGREFLDISAGFCEVSAFWRVPQRFERKEHYILVQLKLNTPKCPS
jgi:hypothetical protein